MEQKTQARDDDGKIMKATEMPPQREICCPLVFQLTGNAVRYDLTFLSTQKLGDGPVGCWRSAPLITLTEEAKEALKSGEKKWAQLTDDDIQLDSKGQKKARAYALAFWKTLEKLREDGKISWDDHAFLFSHAQGVRAREQYIQSVLKGQHKANKRSWSGTPGDPDKPGFSDFCSTSWEKLEAGEVPDAARPMKSIEWFQEAQPQEEMLQYADMTLGEYLRQVVYKKATSSYLSKSAKKEKIANAIKKHHISMTDVIEHLDTLADETGMAQNEIKEIILGDVPSPPKADAAETEEITEEPEPSVDELAEIEGDMEEDLVAGATAIEAIPTDSTDDEVDLCEPIMVFPSANKERIAPDEAIVVYGSDGEDHVYHLVELPSGHRLWVEENASYEVKIWRDDESYPEIAERVIVKLSPESTEQEAN